MVDEGAPLRFTLSRDQPHGSLRSAEPAEHEVAASAAVNVTAVNDPATGAPMAGRVRHLLPPVGSTS